MSTSETQRKEAAAQGVRIDDDALIVDLLDGRTIAEAAARHRLGAGKLAPDRGRRRDSLAGSG